MFYVNRWIRVTQDGGADWQELARKVAEPIRAAPAAHAQSAATVAAATTAIADLSAEDHRRLDEINALLDEQIRPYLQGDGGELHVLGLEATSSASTTRARAGPAYYRQPMVRQEADLFPHLDRVFGTDDWKAVDHAIASEADPLFRGRIEKRYRQLHRQIMLASQSK